MAAVIPLNVRLTPPMKTVRQRALLVVSERIKPFSTRLESLSMKLANSVHLTDCSIGQEPARHGRLLRGEGEKDRCATTDTEKLEPYYLEYGEDISGPRTREMPAIVRLSRKVSVGQAPTAASLPIPLRKKMRM